MTPIRELLSDLVERRLWPIAALLVAGLVAVPLLLAKPAAHAPASNDGIAALPTAPPAAHGSAGPVVSVAAQAPHGAKLHGKAKNPFKQQHVPPKPKADQATSPASGTPSSGGATPGTGDGATGGNPGHPTGKTFTQSAIDVRFGKAGHKLRSITDVPRLTPLPNAANPVVIFLGMRKDHQTAVFLISSDVRVQGDGKCVPSKDDCEAIELKQDQVAFLDVKRANGVVDQYELDLVKVTITQTTSKAAAQASYARASRAGRRLLRHPAATSAESGIALAGPLFRYAPQRGILHIGPRLTARYRRHHRHHAARARTRP
jgi:hypothetical protein